MPPAGYFLSLSFLFCLRRDTFFPWRKKVSKERHLRKGGFRFPPFLKNPFPLKRPKREGCGPPSLETPSGGWAIIKSRLCRAAAKVGGGQGPLVRKYFAAGRRSVGGGALPRPKHCAKTAGGAEPLPYGQVQGVRSYNGRRGDVGIAPYGRSIGGRFVGRRDHAVERSGTSTLGVHAAAKKEPPGRFFFI